MAGHLGAAVVAGYFVGEELPELDGKVYAAIEGNLDQIVRGDEAIWYNVDQTGIAISELFETFPDESIPDETIQSTRIASIATALSANIDTLRQSGHNVIFSSIAIRALHDHSMFATNGIVHGIVQLIARFNDAGPGRGYYGKERGWILGNDVKLDDENDFPAYRDQQDMVEVVIEELVQSAAIRRQGYGGLFHLINHAAALTELTRFGFDELAGRGMAAHHNHVRLWRSLPDVEKELGPLVPAIHDPRTPEYWLEKDSNQWSAHSDASHQDNLRVPDIAAFYSVRGDQKAGRRAVSLFDGLAFDESL